MTVGFLSVPARLSANSW